MSFSHMIFSSLKYTSCLERDIDSQGALMVENTKNVTCQCSRNKVEV